jgi:hypothetical protein
MSRTDKERCEAESGAAFAAADKRPLTCFDDFYAYPHRRSFAVDVFASALSQWFLRANSQFLRSELGKFALDIYSFDTDRNTDKTHGWSDF